MATRVINAPKRKRRFMVFDVETTDKIKKNAPLDQQPYIIQLSFVIYDLQDRRIIKRFDSYVNIPQNIVISEFITGLTGATREKCDNGLNILDILEEFYHAYFWCDEIVAHNIDFDTQMMLFEIERNREEIMKKMPYCSTIFNTIYEKVNRIERYCTMKRGMNFCDIILPIMNNNIIDTTSSIHPFLMETIKQEKKYKKWPKLSELYFALFDENPDGLHNSMMDVLVCLRCYLKMRHSFDGGLLV
jgi:DNA polymerase III epsilon subunit-like protein